MNSDTETIITTILPKSKGGRPKKYLPNEFDRQAYNKSYYEKNRDKYIGEFNCIT